MAYIGKVPTAVPLSSADIEDGTIQLADLSATGTKDATTFLRGDNTFAEAGGGKVLQVVSATDSTGRSTTSSTFVNLSNTLSVNITPSSTSSKIFIIANVGIHTSGATGNSVLTIFRDGTTNLGNGNNGIAQLYYEQDADIASSQALSILDTPNTTSQVNYQIYIRAAISNAFLNIFGSTSSITAFEIAG